MSVPPILFHFHNCKCRIKPRHYAGVAILNPHTISRIQMQSQNNRTSMSCGRRFVTAITNVCVWYRFIIKVQEVPSIISMRNDRCRYQIKSTSLTNKLPGSFIPQEVVITDTKYNVAKLHYTGCRWRICELCCQGHWNKKIIMFYCFSFDQYKMRKSMTTL